MHIILVSDRLTTAKTLTVSSRMMSLAVFVFLLSVCAVFFLVSWVGGRFNPSTAERQAEVTQQANDFKAEEYLRENVKTMAVKVGEMQAQLVQLDALGERISKQSGISLPKNEASSKPKKENSLGGAGGPLVNPLRPHSASELQVELERLSTAIGQRVEELTALESQLMERRVKTTLLPTLLPVQGGQITSPFGPRVDPIAGVGAMHEGVDFSVSPGTRISAAAGGIVTTAEYHSAYGHLVEIDHGNDFSSRYAHLSKIDVKVGQLVKRGQLIALSGNSGRSTGPHLHFEVRYRGIAQNPARFFQMGTNTGVNTRLAKNLDKLDLLKPDVAKTLAAKPAETKKKRKATTVSKKSGQGGEASAERTQVQFQGKS